MKKNFHCLFIVPASLFLLSSFAIAEPSVSKVSGTVSSGQSMVINGSNFGSKSPAAPLLWETFNDGKAGGNITANPKWKPYVSSPKYSTTAPYGGAGLSALNVVAYGDKYESKFASANFTFPGTNELYYSYMSRHVGASTGGKVYKNGRINTGNNMYSGDGMIAISDGYVFYRPGSSTVYPSVRNFKTVNIGSSNWQRHQMYAKASNPAGNANGHIFSQVHTHLNDYRNIVSKASGYNFQYSSILLGTMMDQPGSGETHEMYIDDVYVDKTLARVELCSGSTWANRTVCDPQIPTAWSNSSISVNVNKGAFASNQLAYLYVVDASGSVNKNGFPVTIGKGQATNPPPATNPSVNAPRDFLMD